MNLFTAELEFELASIKRYPLNYLSNIILLVMMFFGIFWGGALLGANPIGNTFTSMILGYSLWILIVQTVGNMGMQISSEAQTGTLEQLYLMPVNPVKTFFIKSLVNLIFSITYSILILLILMAFTGRWVHISLSAGIPYLLALVAVLGLGYFIASLSLRYKRIGVTLQIAQYIYLGLILYDFRTANSFIKLLGYVIPIEPMVNWIQDIVNNTNFNLGFNLTLSICNAAVWLILGILYFKRADYITKKEGTVAFF